MKSLLLVRIITIILLVAIVFPSSYNENVHGAVGTSLSPLWFSHVVWIVMENHKLAQITAIDNSSTAFQLGIRSDFASAENSGYESTSGSLPNYLAMTSGATQTTCDSGPATCGTFSVTNIVDNLITAGLTWKAYFEGWSNSSNTNGCNGAMRGDGGTNYIAHHNPFIYYGDIITTSSRCSQLVAAGSYAGSTSCANSIASNTGGNLISDLNSASPPNFMYYVPNNYDNTHDCLVDKGNTYLKTLVPQILNSTTFVQTPSAVIITYDEGTDAATTEPVYTVWAGRQAQNLYSNSTQLNHYNVLRTIEDNWGLPTLTSNDAGVSNERQFLQTLPSTSAPKIDSGPISVYQGNTYTPPVSNMHLPAATNPNDLIMYFIFSGSTAILNGGCGCYTVTDSDGLTWNQRGTAGYRGATFNMGNACGGCDIIYEFYALSPSAIKPDTITVNWPGGVASAVGQMAWVISNVNQAQPFDGTIQTANGSTNANGNAVDTESLNSVTLQLSSTELITLAGFISIPLGNTTTTQNQSCLICVGTVYDPNNSQELSGIGDMFLMTTTTSTFGTFTMSEESKWTDSSDRFWGMSVDSVNPVNQPTTGNGGVCTVNCGGSSGGGGGGFIIKIPGTNTTLYISRDLIQPFAIGTFIAVPLILVSGAILERRGRIKTKTFSFARTKRRRS